MKVPGVLSSSGSMPKGEVATTNEMTKAANAVGHNLNEIPWYYVVS